jgi:hypothetical protein
VLAQFHIGERNQSSTIHYWKRHRVVREPDLAVEGEGVPKRIYLY